jgi:AsmA protein
VHVAPDGTRAENINLVIPAFGTLTGAGTVSPNNALSFKMVAKLSGTAVTAVSQMAGMGSGGGSIPFMIEGTTSDPKFIPDVKGMAGGFLQNALQGNKNNPNQKNPLSGITGLFKKKQ